MSAWASAGVTLRPRVWNGKGRAGGAGWRGPEDTHSTYLVQGGGSRWAMNTQLVRMVHMMSMLKSMAQGQGKPPAGGRTGCHRQGVPPQVSAPPGQGCQINETGAPRRHTRALPSPCQPLPTEAGHLPCSTAPNRDRTPECKQQSPLWGPSWREGRRGRPSDLRGFYPWPSGSAVLGHTRGRWVFINSFSGSTVSGRGKPRWQGPEFPPPLLWEQPRLTFELGLLPKRSCLVRTQ